MKTESEILEYVKDRGCSIPHHLSEYRMQGIPEEFASFIYCLQGGSYDNYLEVGSAASGTTRMYNDFFHFKNIVIIDDNGQPTEYIHRQSNLNGLPYVEYIGDSQGKEAKEFVRGLGYRFDLVYIDGDHSYDGVKNDFNNYFEFVNRGGMITFHDTRIFPGVKKFISELKDYPGILFIDEFYKKMGMAIFQKK